MTKTPKTVLEEAVPVKEIKAPTVRSFRRFIKSVLVIFLSIVCIGAGILIYQMHHRLDSFRPMLPVLRSSPLKPLSNKPAPLSVKPMMTPVVKQPEAPQTDNTADTKTPPETIVETDSSYPMDTVAPTLPKEKETEAPVIPVVSVPAEPLLPAFALHDALMLRDHLTAAVSCRQDLQTLLKSRVPGDTWNVMVEKLTPICVTNETIMSEIEHVFQRNKKRALIAYYHSNNPWWLAYLKAFGLAVIEIRKLNPNTESPADIVSLAQNRLLQRDIVGAADLVRRLPAEMTSAFQPFLTKADDYQAALQEVNRLILLFEQKGV